MEPVIIDTLERLGEVVYEMEWLGEGAENEPDVERIYRYHGQYYAVLSFQFEVAGPYPSLQDVFTDYTLNIVNEMVISLRAPDLSAAELIPMLSYDGIDDEHNFLLNGDPYTGSSKGFQPAK